MKRLDKYIETFGKIGVGAGIVFGLFASLKMGSLLGIIIGIKFGLLGAIFMAMFLIPLDYMLTRKLPDKALSVHQANDIQVYGNIDEVFKHCIDFMKKSKAIKKAIPDKEHLLITARTRLTFKSVGENITLQFKTLPNGLVKVTVKSNPAIKATLLDYGSNYKNVEWISKEITNNFPEGKLE